MNSIVQLHFQFSILIISSYVPDLPGVVAAGKTKEKVEKNIFEAIQFHLEGLNAEKIAIPKSQADSEVLVFTVK